MKLLSTTLLLTLLAAPAFADDWGKLKASGAAKSSSVTSGLAVSGGGHSSGFSSVENFQGARHSAGASAKVLFTERDGHKKGRDFDGLRTDIDLETYSVGSQISETRSRDWGQGTTAMGGGAAKSSGGAEAWGGFVTGGMARW